MRKAGNRILAAAVLAIASGAAFSAPTGAAESAIDKPAADAPAPAAVVEAYVKLATAMYADSLTTAERLQAAVERLLASPSAENFEAARAAWLEARRIYPQTEALRFGNPVVDEWEGKVNAWPLDEGLIDYVDRGYEVASDQNPLHSANIVASVQLSVGARVIDAHEITPALLESELHQIGQIEANVATGYHAIEFLLWGQDLNGTGPGAGERPWTDYAQDAQCTHGNCDRRAAFLRAATELLVNDLRWMANEWQAGGSAREVVTGVPSHTGLSIMLTGLGSLSYGELAGERMKLGLLLNDPEEEQDCFSDNTHNSHFYNVVGMESLYLGRYQRADGSTLSGASLSALVAARAPALDAEMRQRLTATHEAMAVLKKRAEEGERFDQMIAPGNTAGHAVVQAAIDALTAQTRSIERIVGALELQPIQIEGSDSLDNPAAVFGAEDPAAVFQ